MVIFWRGQRLADHPGRGHEDLRRPAAGAGGGGFGDLAHALLPGLAGKGVGVAAIDHQHPGLAALQLVAAPQDRGAEAVLEVVKTPATWVPGASRASSTSVRLA